MGSDISQEEDNGPLHGGSPVLSPMLANIFSISTTVVKDIAIEQGSIDGNHLIMTYTIMVAEAEWGQV
jgi:hypothetical protein